MPIRKERPPRLAGSPACDGGIRDGNGTREGSKASLTEEQSAPNGVYP